MFVRHCGEAVVHEAHEYTKVWARYPDNEVRYRCPGWATTYRTQTCPRCGIREAKVTDVHGPLDSNGHRRVYCSECFEEIDLARYHAEHFG